MARKKGSSIADFDNVATQTPKSFDKAINSINTKTNTNNNVNTNTNTNNTNDNVNTEVDANNDNDINTNASTNDDINSILESNKKNEKVMAGIYFEKEVAKQLDKLSKKGGRGTKSKLVNAAVKKMLQEQNML